MPYKANGIGVSPTLPSAPEIQRPAPQSFQHSEYAKTPPTRC